MSEGSFKPAWWLPNSHLQTLWPVLCRRSIQNLPLKRERFELPDGDFIDLEWTHVTDKDAPLVVILHGLEGSIESSYAKGMLTAITRQGWRGVFMHFRGCSGEHNRLPRSYHSGDTGDVAYLVQVLREREPYTPIAAVGFSLGGNVLLKWLGQTGADNLLSAAVAISVPFELKKSLGCIQQGFSRFYHQHLLGCLLKRMSNKFQSTPPNIELPEWSSLRDLYEFDDKITAPLHGFANAEEYYAKSSSRQYLPEIHVPTLIVHAKDDPFTREDIIPTREELSPAVQLEVTEAGGHVGFVSGKYPWEPQYWLEERIPKFLGEYLFDNH